VPHDTDTALGGQLDSIVRSSKRVDKRAKLKNLLLILVKSVKLIIENFQPSTFYHFQSPNTSAVCEESQPPRYSHISPISLSPTPQHPTSSCPTPDSH